MKVRQRLSLTQGLLYAGAALTPLLIMPNLVNGFALPKALFIRLLALLLGALTLVDVLPASQPEKLRKIALQDQPVKRFPLSSAGEGQDEGVRLRHQILAFLISLVVVTLILSSILSTSPALSLWGLYGRQEGLITRFSYLIIALCAVHSLRTEQDVLRLLQAMVWSSLPAVILGLAQAIGWQQENLVSDASTALISTLGRSNMFGTYLLLVIPLTTWLAYRAKLRVRQIGYTVLLVAQIICLYLTKARSAWLGLGGCMAIMVLLILKRKWRLIMIGSVIVLGITGIIWLINLPFDSLPTSWRARVVIWRTVLPLIRQRPWLGYGLDSLRGEFLKVYPPELVYYQGRNLHVDRAHSLLLDSVLSVGVLGTLALASLWAGAVWGSFRTVHLGDIELSTVTTNHPHPTPLPQGVLADSNPGKRESSVPASSNNTRYAENGNFNHVLNGILIAVLAGYTADMLVGVASVSTTLWVWLLWAMLIKLPRLESNPLSHQKLTLTHGLFAVGALALASVLVLRPLLAEEMYTEAIRNQNNIADQYEKSQSAVQLWPYEAEYTLLLAQTEVMQGHLKGMDSTFIRAERLLGDDPVLYERRGHMLMQACSGERVQTDCITLAVYAYQRAQDLAPTVAIIHRYMGVALMTVGDLDGARRALEHSRDLDITDPTTHYLLFELYQSLDMLDVAQDALYQSEYWLEKTGTH